MNKLLVIILIIVICIIANVILFNFAQKRKGIKKKILILFISIFSVLPILYGYHTMDFIDHHEVQEAQKDQTADKSDDSSADANKPKSDDGSDNSEINTSVFIREIKGGDFYSVANANDLSESEIQIRELDRSMTMLGRGEDESYSVDDLIGRRICTVYSGEDGETCLFAGQYNKNYHWDGQCLICAYKDSKLLYTTQDTYIDGKLIAYKRISKYSAKNKWMYTDRILTEAGNNGDTWSYDYRDISEKNYDADDLKEEQIITPFEVRDQIQGDLISHYYGKYVDHEPNDDSGDAYQIKYVGGKITEIYRGSFYNLHYIEGFCIKIAYNSDGKTYKYMKGTFFDKEGNEIDEFDANKEIDESEFRNIILTQPFSREVLGN